LSKNQAHGIITTVCVAMPAGMLMLSMTAAGLLCIMLPCVTSLKR
jgi:hypothetical protein